MKSQEYRDKAANQIHIVLNGNHTNDQRLEAAKLYLELARLTQAEEFVYPAPSTARPDPLWALDAEEIEAIRNMPTD